MRRYQRRPWCVCFDGSKFAQNNNRRSCHIHGLSPAWVSKECVIHVFGKCIPRYFYFDCPKCCRPAGPSSRMSCRSHAKVVGLGPTDRREFPTLVLTHWGRDKMAAFFQTKFSNAFSWMKMFELRIKFHWSLFKDPINSILALVQMMAWRLPGDKPLSEPMLVSLLTHICVTRPQWVKSSTILVPVHPSDCSQWPRRPW